MPVSAVRLQITHFWSCSDRFQCLDSTRTLEEAGTSRFEVTRDARLVCRVENARFRSIRLFVRSLSKCIVRVGVGSNVERASLVRQRRRLVAQLGGTFLFSST